MGFEAVARGRKVSAVEAGPVEGTWDLPEGWRWERLGNCGNWSSGGTPSAKDARYYGGTIPWLTSGELNDAVVSRSEKMITEEGYANSSVKWLPSDTLLVAMYGATIGKAAVTGFRCTTNQAVAACQPHPGYNVRYLLYYVLSQRDNLRNLGQGGAQPNISQALLKDYPCPVAPAVDQQKIVARIDALFSEIDEGVAALAEARAGVEVYRKALLKAAVTGELTADWRAANPPEETGEQLLGCILADRRARWHADPKNARKRYTEPAGPDTEGLPELPEGWTWATLQQIAFISGGATVDKKRKPADPVEVPYLRVANVQRGSLDLSVLKTITVDRAKLSDLLLRSGDILLNEGGDRDKVGRGWIWEGQAEICAHQNHVFKARPASNVIEPRLVSMYLNELGRKFFFDESKQTTNLASISLSKVSLAPVAIPPAREASAIIAQLDAMSENEIGEPALADLDGVAATLRQSILAAAFRGELLV